ncbi:MAG: helix-turn-helix transcriptional regulator [Agathobacter sp.]|nr:helix-turn-helix transcriptional regulator [Agathobacter sp.]
MKPAYNEIYLDDAMENMGEMIDYAVNVCHMDIEEFWKLFLSSGLAEEFGKGSPKAVSGTSGTEMVYQVFDKAGMNDKEFPIQIEYARSREYWSGWILAYYQWLTGKSFKDIYKGLSMEEIQRLYPTLHEAPEEKFVEVANRIIATSTKSTKLQELRKNSGYSQSELAERSGVNKRMIQQYEIGAKDINKAAGMTLLALARVLGCEVEELLEI